MLHTCNPFIAQNRTNKPPEVTALQPDIVQKVSQAPLIAGDRASAGAISNACFVLSHAPAMNGPKAAKKVAKP